MLSVDVLEWGFRPSVGNFVLEGVRDLHFLPVSLAHGSVLVQVDPKSPPFLVRDKQGAWTDSRVLIGWLVARLS